MKHLISGIFVCVLCLLIGILTFQKFHSPQQDEKPPCDDCREIYEVESNIETVNLELLITKPDKYLNRIVRLQSDLTIDIDSKSFYQVNQNKNYHLAGTGLRNNFNYCAGTKDKLYGRFIDGLGDKHLNVVVLGKLKKSATVDLEFEILCVEEAERVELSKN